MKTSKKQKNCIWIMTDQQPAYMLSCNGDPNLNTPNIDTLADYGVNFKNAVGGFPLCCPFRGSMLTSVYPHQCVPGHEFMLPPEMPTVATAFKAEGYHTAYIGKWHLDGFHEQEGRAAFHIVPPERRGDFDYWVGYENNNSQYDSWVHGGEGENAFHYRLDGYETDKLTDLLIEYIENRDEDSPFFAVLSVQPPHDPYTAPAEYKSKFNPQDITLRPNIAHVKRVEKTARQELSGAYAMVENMDANVGRIIEVLRKKGIDLDTNILYFSDHGDMHGSHGQFRKLTAYAESVNIPFIVSSGVSRYGHRNNTVVNHPINHVDIAPTSLGLCGIKTPDYMQGTDYSAVFTGGPSDTKYPTSAYLQNLIPTGHGDSIDKPWRGIVTSDGWKYACLENCDWLLFNLNEDPYEEANLAHNSAYRQKRQQLKSELVKWAEKTGDNFPIPD